MKGMALKIIAILLTISLVVATIHHRRKSEAAKLKGAYLHAFYEIRELNAAMDLFYLDYKHYPKTLHELMYSSVYPKMTEAKFIRKTTGQWGRKYIYEILDDDAQKHTSILKISALGENGDPNNIFHSTEIIIPKQQ